MEVNKENSETTSPKTKFEELPLKNQEDSSKNLKINEIQSNNYNNNINQNNTDTINPKKEETNKEIIIFTSNTQLNSERKKINPTKSRYPYCIVWSPIPFLTYIIPCIGYVGIANSEGIIHDFSTSFFINIDDFIFGKPTKYYQLELTNKEEYEFDNAIKKGDIQFNSLRHNIFWNNCHNHVAYVLNQLNYKGKSNYNIVDIWWLLILKGKYISFWAFIKTYLGFFIFLLIIGFAIR